MDGSHDIKRNRLCVGVDLGGTKVAAGLVYDGHQLLSHCVFPVDGAVGAHHVIATIEKVIVSAIDEGGVSGAGIDSIGIGMPAAAVRDGQNLPACPGLPSVGDVPLRQILIDRFRCHVNLENDANCFAIGEFIAGEGLNVQQMVGVTLGTGIGVGIVINGQILRGSHGAAGEVWDLPMPAGGVLEARLKGCYLAQQAGCNDGKDAVEKARAGDQVALSAVREYAKNLAWLLGFVGRLLDPELIVLGGSLSCAYDLFQPTFENEISTRWPIAVSKLREKAAIIGATCLNRDEPKAQF